MATAVPAPTFGSTGFVAPTEAAILAGVQTDINTAFGGNVNLSLAEPQGQLASSETAIIGDAYDQFLALANGVDPAYASGRLQDAIGRLYFLTRNPAQPTTVSALITGLVGTVIPAGALAADTSGNLYGATTGGTIGAGGTVTLAFAAIATGPQPLAAGALSKVYKAIPGWDTVTNAAPGITGNIVETRAAFEARRQATVAIGSVNALVSVQAVVLQVANVLDAYVTDNDTGASVTRGGVTLVKNSIYVAVAGGDPQAVANAIWTKKPPGCDMNGDTTRTVQDTTNYVTPYPSYSITFQTAASTPIYFAATLASTPNVPANAASLIQAAVVAAFTGASGGPRARIGSTIFASNFYAAITALGSWVELLTLFVGTAASPTTTTTTVNIAQIPALAPSNVSVVFQ